MKRGVLTCLMTVLLMGADCGQTLHDCPEGTAIPNVNFENGSRECIPFDEICFAEDRSSTIACADCPTCDPYEPPDAGVPDGSVDGDVPDGHYYWLIREGSENGFPVEGFVVEEMAMPAYGGDLTEAEMWALVSYMRSLQNAGS